VKVHIEFNMDSAASQDDPSDALGFIFAQAQRKIHEQLARKGGTICTAPEAGDKLLDPNGNTVGTIQVIK
jgi:hypothetical protein